MDPKQTALANNFPKMIAALQTLPGGLPDVHIGVVSSNMGAGNGAMGGNCGNGLGDRAFCGQRSHRHDRVGRGRQSLRDRSKPPFDRLWLRPQCWSTLDRRHPGSQQSGRIRNYTNLQLQDVFSCLAKAVGVAGCGEEHQLQATRVALIPQPSINTANNGFLRSNAYLAIVSSPMRMTAPPTMTTARTMTCSIW